MHRHLIGTYAIRQLAALQHAWHAQGSPNKLRVLDLEALGSHFHAIAQRWPWGSLDWTVCETEAVTAAGKAEFQLETPEGHQLHFSSKPIEVLDKGVDVILASCSLQYFKDWGGLLELFQSSPWLILDRVPLIEHHSDIIDIQVVPATYTDTRYPGWKFAASKWLPRLKEAGFDLVFRWIVPEDRWSILDINTGKFG